MIFCVVKTEQKQRRSKWEARNNVKRRLKTVFEGSPLDLHGFKEPPLPKEQEYLFFCFVILLLRYAKVKTMEVAELECQSLTDS